MNNRNKEIIENVFPTAIQLEASTCYYSKQNSKPSIWFQFWGGKRDFRSIDFDIIEYFSFKMNSNLKLEFRVLASKCDFGPEVLFKLIFT